MSVTRRNALLIAFHYPPCATSSGVQRALAFSTHLRSHGWHPIVLTATPGAHEHTSPTQLSDIPADVPVIRTTALDAARHLSFQGRYWSRLAIPDRWASWKMTAVPRALGLVRRHRIEVIWSTYPITTAHSIAASVARMTGVPWVADFRDPMVEYITATGAVSPADPAIRNARLRIERLVTRHAAAAAFCTDAARRIVAERYPDSSGLRLEVIPNGFAEQAFQDAQSLVLPRGRAERRTLLHSGIVYPGTDRDPTALLQALRSLADERLITPADFELRLRDPSNEAYFRQLAEDLGVSEFVSIVPALPYREALAEMLTADGLLLLQGYTSNPAIPAKLYEYLRARRPIVALVHSGGETAAALRRVGIDTIAPLTDPALIRELLLQWLSKGQELAARLPSQQTVAQYSRERLTARLADLLTHAAATCAARSL